MLTNYFTLRGLVREWKPLLLGRTVEDVYSQEKGELTIALAPPGETGDAGTALKISVQAPLRYIYLASGVARARRNVSSQFPSLIGTAVTDMSIAKYDRRLDIRFSSGSWLTIELYGPRANVYLLDDARRVVDRFRQRGLTEGESPATGSPAGLPSDVASFCQSLTRQTGPMKKRLRRVFPVLDPQVVDAILAKAGIDAQVDQEPGEPACGHLFHAVREMLEALESPTPVLYKKRDRVASFSLIPLEVDREDTTSETAESVDAAVRIFVRHELARTAREARAGAIERALTDRLARAKRSRDRMAAELKKESRADGYEHRAHLLMAMQADVPTGAEEVELEDVVSGAGSVTIPLDARLNAVQNAERYYDRARDTRRARRHAERRLEDADRLIRDIEQLVAELGRATTASEVEKFRKQNRALLSTLSSQRTESPGVVPFRRYVLEAGYEVWVGRSAEQNDRLTLKTARKFDLWMHARGVSGSHAVLRLPRRDETPPRRIIEQAASIAAYHSKARTSSLAPVIVAECRYVRKPRKSPPGTVAVERERVVMVPPKRPADKDAKNSSDN